MALFYRPNVWDKMNDKDKGKNKKKQKAKSARPTDKKAHHSQSVCSEQGFDDIWQINSPTSGQTDLLGLSSPPVAAAPAPSNTGNLVDILGDIGGEPNAGVRNAVGNGAAPAFGNSDAFGMGLVSAEDNYYKFVSKHNGILFENDLLQVGVKSEYRQNLGRISLFYGNKTQTALTDFQTVIAENAEDTNKLVIMCKQPVDSVVNASEQKQQLIEIECVRDFSQPPKLQISFMYSRVQQNISMRLPVMINKFIEPAEMDSSTFFMRWKQLSGPSQECQKIVKATNPQSIGTDALKTKLLGFGASVLEGVDPNPENYVMAGVVHTKESQIGGLLRLEANKQAMMYRVTVRSSKDTVAQELCALLESQL